MQLESSPRAAAEDGRQPKPRAPGVSVEPRLELPAPKPDGETMDQVVTLASPQGNAAIRRVVEEFFDAVTSESTSQLQEVFSDNCLARFPNRVVHSALAAWARRFGAGDYAAISPGLLYRHSDLEVYRAQDLEMLAGRRTLELQPEELDVVIVVPLQTRTARGKSLFGSELQMLLREQSGRLEIIEIFEDYVAR